MPTCRGRRKAKGTCAWLRVTAIQPLEQLNLQSDAVYLLTVPVVCSQDQAALYVEPPLKAAHHGGNTRGKRQRYHKPKRWASHNPLGDHSPNDLRTSC